MGALSRTDQLMIEKRIDHYKKQQVPDRFITNEEVKQDLLKILGEVQNFISNEENISKNKKT